MPNIYVSMRKSTTQNTNFTKASENERRRPIINILSNNNVKKENIKHSTYLLDKNGNIRFSRGPSDRYDNKI